MERSVQQEQQCIGTWLYDLIFGGGDSSDEEDEEKGSSDESKGQGSKTKGGSKPTKGQGKDSAKSGDNTRSKHKTNKPMSPWPGVDKVGGDNKREGDSSKDTANRMDMDKRKNNG